MGVNMKCENWHSDPPGGLKEVSWAIIFFKTLESQVNVYHIDIT